jgi:pimeloyl-ACP methyl ester carboxylesterase
MDRALVAAGFATLNLGYDSRHKPLDQLADDIHPVITGFAAGLDGPLHFVTHSMGGLLARVYVSRHRPASLGKVVMLGPPNNGSEIADFLQNRAIYRGYFGPAGQQLTTRHGSSLPTLLGPVDYPLGVIAGNRPINPVLSGLLLPGPNDGKVTVRSTELEGMTDHVVVPAAHSWMMGNAIVIAQTIVFLRDGRFSDIRPQD